MLSTTKIAWPTRAGLALLSALMIGALVGCGAAPAAS